MRDRQRALNHDAIESAAIVSSVINKPMTLSCVYHLSTDNLLWQNFLSPQWTQRHCNPQVKKQQQKNYIYRAAFATRHG